MQVVNFWKKLRKNSKFVHATITFNFWKNTDFEIHAFSDNNRLSLFSPSYLWATLKNCLYIVERWVFLCCKQPKLRILQFIHATLWTTCIIRCLIVENRVFHCNSNQSDVFCKSFIVEQGHVHSRTINLSNTRTRKGQNFHFTKNKNTFFNNATRILQVVTSESTLKLKCNATNA
jgi:hypothetical protein